MPSDVPTPLLSARDLVAVLEGDAGEVRVLDGVALDLSEGEVIDVVGPSGSGKSTLLRALARLLPAATGTLLLDGLATTEFGPQEWRTYVTLLPQKPVVADGTVRDNLALPWRFKVRAAEGRPGEHDFREALDALGLEEISLDREAARLSVGQQARLAFARVLLTAPRVLLLDEADAALDDASAARLTTVVDRFAREGGLVGAAGAPGGVVRVRHRADDGLASRRLRLAHGCLQEVPR